MWNLKVFYGGARHEKFLIEELGCIAAQQVNVNCPCALLTVASSPALVDKEEVSHLKKASNAAPRQPTWMELAKKKSQAWSDMPQIIK